MITHYGFLIFIFVMISDGEHLFRYLLAICSTSVEFYNWLNVKKKKKKGTVLYSIKTDYQALNIKLSLTEQT